MTKAPAIAALAVLLAAALPHAASCAAQQPLPVPMSVIYPGEALDTAALTDKLFTVPEKAAASYVLDRAQLHGLYAKRPLLPGRPIPLSYLKPRDAIVQGTPTRATFHAAGLTITTMLIPLQAGSVGDFVDARNPEFNTTVKARVMEDGSLQVGAP